MRIVIGPVPFDLHIDEVIREILDITWKTAHHLPVHALVFCEAVIDRMIGFSPCRLASVGAGGADKAIRTIPAHGMEHGVKAVLRARLRSDCRGFLVAC